MQYKYRKISKEEDNEYAIDAEEDIDIHNMSGIICNYVAV